MSTKIIKYKLLALAFATSISSMALANEDKVYLFKANESGKTECVEFSLSDEKIINNGTPVAPNLCENVSSIEYSWAAFYQGCFAYYRGRNNDHAVFAHVSKFDKQRLDPEICVKAHPERQYYWGHSEDGNGYCYSTDYNMPIDRKVCEKRDPLKYELVGDSRGKQHCFLISSKGVVLNYDQPVVSKLCKSNGNDSSDWHIFPRWSKNQGGKVDCYAEFRGKAKADGRAKRFDTHRPINVEFCSPKLADLRKTLTIVKEFLKDEREMCECNSWFDDFNHCTESERIEKNLESLQRKFDSEVKRETGVTAEQIEF